MYCPSCGEEIPDDSDFCRHCGESLSPATNQVDTDERESGSSPAGEPDSEKSEGSHNQWDPKLPITSVFVSILLLWVTLDVSNFSGVLIFGVPGILIIPRVRRYLIRWVDNQYGRDLTADVIRLVVALVYAILIALGGSVVIASTADDPSLAGPIEQLTVGFITIGIMFVFAAVIVTAIRINRKLQN